MNIAGALGEIAAFHLGFTESDGDVGMTYDGDPESPRSQAYDMGRTVGEWPEPWRSIFAAAPEMAAMLDALLNVCELNMDDMEADTLAEIERARALLAKIDGRAR